MSIKKTVKELKEATKILEPFVKHKPPRPQVGAFYSTLNNSLVCILAKDSDDDTFKAVLLKGGYDHYETGDSYWLNKKGLYMCASNDGSLVLSLKEKLKGKLPKVE